jgi:glutamate dehydrogenase/leucine dehydrogenase
MKAVRHALDGTDELAGCRVVVSGVGKVGSFLVDRLLAEGAVVTVADVNPAAVERIRARSGVTAVAVEEAHLVPCDIFSPCALGGVLDAKVVFELNCRGVVGSANNQLATPEDGRVLADRGIVYAPDFVVNSGGVINIADELAGYEHGYDQDRAYARVRGIFDTTLQVLRASEEQQLPPGEVAEAMAEQRIAKASRDTDRIRCFDGTAHRHR